MRAPALVTVGGVAGLAWSAALRGYMAELAGTGSQVDWAGTFLAVLLPGAATGALLGWAEALRRQDRHHRTWLALAPLSFAIAPMLFPGALAALFTTGLGGGAIAVPLIGIVGGYALSGRRPRAARVACGAVAGLFVAALISAGPRVGGTRLDLNQPRGAWVAVLVGSLMASLAIAAAIPLRVTRQ